MSRPYARLALMVVAGYALMFVLMYAMVDSFANVYPNVNQAYMAALMTAPMLLLELLIMRGMYANKRVNTLLFTLGLVVLAASFLLIRYQTGVGDREFVRSMIPHHASALLMCREAHLTDPGLQALCDRILTGQQAEIDFMKSKFSSLSD